VLDLGTGSGALGQHLREHAACTVDGVTINEHEAELARPHYRRVEVVNLEDPAWISAFSGEQFDFIVCADVLEHLRDPQNALLASRRLLAPGGRVLISVPNAAYSGLVAELRYQGSSGDPAELAAAIAASTLLPVRSSTVAFVPLVAPHAVRVNASSTDHIILFINLSLGNFLEKDLTLRSMSIADL